MPFSKKKNSREFAPFSEFSFFFWRFFVDLRFFGFPGGKKGFSDGKKGFSGGKKGFSGGKKGFSGGKKGVERLNEPHE